MSSEHEHALNSSECSVTKARKAFHACCKVFFRFFFSKLQECRNPTPPRPLISMCVTTTVDSCVDRVLCSTSLWYIFLLAVHPKLFFTDRQQNTTRCNKSTNQHQGQEQALHICNRGVSTGAGDGRQRSRPQREGAQPKDEGKTPASRPRDICVQKPRRSGEV